MYCLLPTKFAPPTNALCLQFSVLQKEQYILHATPFRRLGHSRRREYLPRRHRLVPRIAFYQSRWQRVFLRPRLALRVAALGARLHLVPAALPFLSPRERPVADDADFGRQVFLFDATQKSAQF